MLSYQHIYHAGSAADVHKHAALACALRYMVQKDKPLTYIETHAGRGIYDLTSTEARKTGEFVFGIQRAREELWFEETHPYQQVVRTIHQKFGSNFYAGSPMLAAEILRPTDSLHLIEKHPQEYKALSETFADTPHIKTIMDDGYQTTLAICPPTPKRGIVLIDPSYEMKQEYTDLPQFIDTLHRKWPVGTIILWYPILKAARHVDMITALTKKHYASTVKSEAIFAKKPDGHGLIGSGLFIINPTFGLSEDIRFVENLLSETRL